MITAGSQHLKKVELGEGEQFAAGAHCSARGKLARPIEEEAADVVHLLLVLLLLLRCHCRPPQTPPRRAQLHRKHSAQYASFIINVASLCFTTFSSRLYLDCNGQKIIRIATILLTCSTLSSLPWCLARAAPIRFTCLVATLWKPPSAICSQCVPGCPLSSSMGLLGFALANPTPPVPPRAT